MTDYKKKPNIIKREEYKFGTKNLVEIFGKLGIPIAGKTKTGNPSISKDTINKFIREDSEETLIYEYEFIKYLHKYKIVSQLLNLFFKPMPEFIQEDGKVRSNFKNTGTVTSRLSSSKPNLQQLANPNKIVKTNVRECFIAPKGYKMISSDFSGQEIAVMAQISKDPTLVKSLNNGYDMHLAIANQFYDLGIPEECLKSTHEKYKEYKSKFKHQRSTAKSVTFGLAYGKSNFGFAKDFGISEEEAQKIIDDYFKGMPKLKEAIDNTHKELKEEGYVRTLVGRYRHFGTDLDEWELGRAQRQSFNFKVQSFAADMIRVAMTNVFKRKKKYPE
jgi:DNA polymerase-1